VFRCFCDGRWFSSSNLSFSMGRLRSALGASRGLPSQDERFPDARISIYAVAHLNVEPIESAEGLPEVAVRVPPCHAQHKAVVPN
jgi:hypothetical protein